jgi:hypothetical protein
MAQDHRLQPQRFELKYLIDEGITLQLRHFLSAHLVLDDYGEGRPNLSYPVHSVYFDSDDLQTHHATLNGTKNRFKLRMRYYDDNPATPVFFEIKARVNNCILKRRCGVRREAVPLLASGEFPEPEHLLSREPRHLDTIRRFHFMMHHIGARPKLHNSYLREAWVSPYDNSVRVTFDRNIRAEPFFRSITPIKMEQPTRVFPEFVVLEVKFTTRYPNWFKEMVRVFSLMQAASAKYSGGVELLGEHRFQPKGAAWQWSREEERSHRDSGIIFSGRRWEWSRSAGESVFAGGESELLKL